MGIVDGEDLAFPRTLAVHDGVPLILCEHATIAIQHLDLPDEVKDDVLVVFNLLGEPIGRGRTLSIVGAQSAATIAGALAGQAGWPIATVNPSVLAACPDLGLFVEEIFDFASCYPVILMFDGFDTFPMPAAKAILERLDGYTGAAVLVFATPADLNDFAWFDIVLDLTPLESR